MGSALTAMLGHRHRELIPRQWVEAMVRVGVLLNENKKPREPSLTESLRMVIQDFVIPYATQSNTEAFREELQTLEVGVHSRQLAQQLTIASLTIASLTLYQRCLVVRCEMSSRSTEWACSVCSHTTARSARSLGVPVTA